MEKENINSWDFLTNHIIFEDMQNIEGELADYKWLFNKTILITGAYGMLASYTVYFLIYLNEIYENANIRILAQGRDKNKMLNRFGKYVNKEYFAVVEQDICQPIEIAEKIDYVIHAASWASPQYYAISPVETSMPNVIGTYYLLELSKKLKTVKGFLFFSSGDVYGSLPDKHDMYCETDYGYIDCMNIRNCYGESKRMGENFCKSYNAQYNIPTFVVRIAHTYGPTLDLKNDKRMFAEFVKNIVNCEDIEMKSDGMAERMFCYLKDATVAFFTILYKGKPGEAYNMYNNTQMISVKELAYKLASMFPEKHLKVIIKGRSESNTYLESPVYKSAVMSIDKLKKLGWNPKTNVDEGFKRTVLSFMK